MSMPSEQADHREASRYRMQLPVVLLLDNGFHSRVLTRDVSATGLFFAARKDLQLNDCLRFLITFPLEITKSCKLLTLCDGVVVRREVMNDIEGVAIKIKKYQFLTSVA